MISNSLLGYENQSKLKANNSIEIIQEMFKHFHPEGAHINRFQEYSLKGLLMLLKMTDFFQPYFLKKIAQHFQRIKPHEKQIMITKDQLLSQLTNPDVRVYQAQDYKTVFNMLSSGTQVLDLEQHTSSRQQKELVNSQAVKTKLDQQDILKIFEKIASNR